MLSLPVEAVEALAAARYLPPADSGTPGRFAVSDLKGFLARNAEGGANEFFGQVEPVDPRVLIEALDRRSEDMARRALEIFEEAFPEVEKWAERERARFIDQARKRFEAILAVTAEGAEVDEALVEDLQGVGASAAWSGSPLPQLLVVLRISRDLVVQTAVEVAEECGRHWALALALLLTRVLPAMDRLTDALAQGYWAAVVGREEESRARYEHVVERSSDGIYEADLEGRVLYANPSLATILGRSVSDLEGTRLREAFAVVGGGPDVLDELLEEVEGDLSELSFEVLRADGVRRQVHVVTSPRRHGGSLVGFQGVVRDVTAGLELERAKNEFLALITQDLRSPITTILGLAVTLEAYADKLSRERLRRMGASVRRQAERISRLADDLYDVSRLESQSLRLTLRPVRLATTVDAALASLEDTSGVEVRVPEDMTAMADARRLEQVVANLVENALAYGDRPVVVEAKEDGEAVVLSVVDHGRGVPSSLVPNLFSRLQTLNQSQRPGTGLGLFLVKGLVEAMGGRVSYERLASGKGAAFRVRIPVPRSR